MVITVYVCLADLSKLRNMKMYIMHHVNQKCCTTTFVSESLFHKLQNKIVNNIEITIKSTQWRPHADPYIASCRLLISANRKLGTTISTVRMRGWPLFYILVKDEFNKNNNVCILHIPLEYLSSSFENLFGTYLNAFRIININSSYQQLL